jgi:hypothetical protein
MPRGATLGEKSSGENISHFTGLRIRVTGVGNLQLKVYSLDDIRSQDIAPLTMQTATDKIPTRLCNFTTQRASFELKTTEMDEHFRINRIVIYSKEVATSYPG